MLNAYEVHGRGSHSMSRQSLCEIHKDTYKIDTGSVLHKLTKSGCLTDR